MHNVWDLVRSHAEYREARTHWRWLEPDQAAAAVCCVVISIDIFVVDDRLTDLNWLGTHSRCNGALFNSHTNPNLNSFRIVEIHWNRTEFRSSRLKLYLNGAFGFSSHWTHSFWALHTLTVNTTSNEFVFVYKMHAVSVLTTARNRTKSSHFPGFISRCQCSCASPHLVS